MKTNKRHTQPDETKHNLRKVPTYISGLDDILEGGIPFNRTTVISGTAGSGKTIFGMEFLYKSAINNEPGIFIGFEETAQEIRENALTLGWNLSKLEKDKKISIIDAHLDNEAIVSGSFSLKGILSILKNETKKIGAKRIVIDALDVILRLFDDPKQVRNELHFLDNWLRSSGLTILLTLRPQKFSSYIFADVYESMSDCLIVLDTRLLDQVSTRRIRVIKYRGSNFGRNEYPYVIQANGIHVAPISTVGLKHKKLGGYISTGIENLDETLGGGFRRGSCVLVAGAPGTGKTILASTFAKQQCSAGEKILYVSFEESELALKGNVKSAGITLDKFTKNNSLFFLTRYPEEMGAEEHFVLLKTLIEKNNPRHVIIDAISACGRMGGKHAAYEYLMRILNFCKSLGMTIILINQTSSNNDIMGLSGNEVSSMVDTVLFMYYVQLAGETNRILQVLKSRGSAHSNKKREYVIGNNGIEIMDLYAGEAEVLTGTSRQIQEEKDIMELKLAEYEIKLKENELEKLKFVKELKRKSIPEFANKDKKSLTKDSIKQRRG